MVVCEDKIYSYYDLLLPNKADFHIIIKFAVDEKIAGLDFSVWLVKDYATNSKL